MCIPNPCLAADWIQSKNKNSVVAKPSHSSAAKTPAVDRLSQEPPRPDGHCWVELAGPWKGPELSPHVHLERSTRSLLPVFTNLSDHHLYLYGASPLDLSSRTALAPDNANNVDLMKHVFSIQTVAEAAHHLYLHGVPPLDPSGASALTSQYRHWHGIGTAEYPNLVVEWFHQVGTPLTTAFYFWHRRTDSNEETECQNEESKCLIELNVLGREIRRLPPDTSLNPSKLHQSLGSHITKHDMTFVLFALSMLMLIYPMPLLICFLC
ncbi:hypothetical protein FB446DRAFT_457919 [Lentinula raphanica]|nr:hypothetical protein FB446DRAFT_457919 [Lentinula raphanica]